MTAAERFSSAADTAARALGCEWQAGPIGHGPLFGKLIKQGRTVMIVFNRLEQANIAEVDALARQRVSIAATVMA